MNAAQSQALTGWSVPADGDARIAILTAMEAVGAESAGYTQTGMLFTIKRGAFGAVMREAVRLGGQYVDSCFFPLGLDAPGEEWRHDASYAGSRGFWCYVRIAFPETLVLEGRAAA